MSKSVEITGTLGKAPELNAHAIKHGKNAGKVRYLLSFSVNTTTRQTVKDENGKVVEYKTLSEEWCDCKYWLSDEEYANHLHHILLAGSPVVIKGEETCTSYRDKRNDERTDRKVNVNTIALNLTSRVISYELKPAKQQETPSDQPIDLDDDIPY